MRSRIFHGRTTHCRLLPRRHAFRYRMFWLAIDLDELPELDRRVRGFGHGRPALVSVRDADHGGPGDGTIRSKVEALVRGGGVHEPVERITLMTIPKVAGYAFRPVSFYLCEADEGRVVALVAEVRNTFGEMHHYVAAPERGEASGDAPLVFRIPKRFYVSPFLDVSGTYDVLLRFDEHRFEIAVHLRDERGLVFSAGMHGRGVPMTSRRLLGAVARAPLFAATIMLRIQWQAILLFAGRGLPVFPKPAPSHPSTVPAASPSLWQRLRLAVVHGVRRRSSSWSAPSPKLLPEREP